MKKALKETIYLLSGIDRNLALIALMHVEGDITDDVFKKIVDQRMMLNVVIETLTALSL